MTAEKDPRIEAVAKLLFTGPLFGYGPAQWDLMDERAQYDRSGCLMAAEDVLQGIDAAAAKTVDIADELRKAGIEEEGVEDGVRTVHLILKGDSDRYWTAMDAVDEALRLKREAGKPDGWEYGIRTTSFINSAYDWTPWTREEVIAECKRRNDHDGKVGYSMTSVPFRRRPAGEPEPLP